MGDWLADVGDLGFGMGISALLCWRILARDHFSSIADNSFIFTGIIYHQNQKVLRLKSVLI